MIKENLKRLIALFIAFSVLFSVNSFVLAAPAAYNVKTNYNATGNGVSDDTAAIQNALNAAAATKTAVYFPAGTYMASQLTVPTGIKIYGDGPSLSIIKRKTNSTNNQYSLIYGKALNNFEISGICIDGNMADNSTPSHDLILFDPQNVNINNCRFTASSAGIYINNGSGGSVTNTQIEKNGVGMLVCGTKNLTVTVCSFTQNSNGFEASSPMNEKITFTKNSVKNNVNHGIIFGGHINVDPMQTACNNSVISNNEVKDNGAYGIADSSSNSVVSDNIVTGNGANLEGWDASPFAGILINGYNQVIKNNRVIANKGSFSIDGGDAVKSLYMGNTIEDNIGGFNLGTVDYITVTNNTIGNNGGPGAAQISIHGKDGGGDGKGGTCVFQGLTNHVTVNDNNFSVKNGQRGIYVERDTTDINIINNTVTGSGQPDYLLTYEAPSGTCKGNKTGSENPNVISQDTVVIPDACDSFTVSSGFVPIHNIETFSSNAFKNQVFNINVKSPGSGYTSTPTVTITGGGGMDAKAQSYIWKNKLDFILLTGNGTLYDSAPKVTISGGGGSGAQAYAVVGCNNFEGRIITVNCQTDVAMQGDGNLQLSGGKFFGGKGSQIVLKG